MSVAVKVVQSRSADHSSKHSLCVPHIGVGGRRRKRIKPHVWNEATYIRLPVAVCARKDTSQHSNI